MDERGGSRGGGWRWARAIALALAVVAAPAAIVDVDYEQIRDLGLGRSLLRELKIDIPGADTDFGASLRRLRLAWDGAKSPLLITAQGMPVDDLRAALTADPVVTPAGDALPLPRDPRYALLPIDDDEVVMGTARGFAAYKPSPWPEPSGAALTFTGAPKDINLGEFADRVDGFRLTLTREGMLVGAIQAKDRKAARGLMNYIAVRLPLLRAAAAVGVDKAQFPNRMIDAAVIERDGAVITITVDLRKNDRLRAEAHQFLVETLRGRMKKAA